MSLPNGAALSLDGVSATTEGSVVKSAKNSLSCGYYILNGPAAANVHVQLQVRGQAEGPWVDIGSAMTGVGGGFMNPGAVGGTEARLVQTGVPSAGAGNPNAPKIYGWILWY